MDKIMVSFVVIILLILISCTHTKGISVVNTTALPVEVTITFSDPSISPIKFSVLDGSDDVIMYDVYSRTSDLLSLGLKEIILDNNNCETHISRSEVENIIQKNGIWKLIIKDTIFNCHITSD